MDDQEFQTVECPKCHKQVPFTFYLKEERFEACEDCHTMELK